MPAARQSDTIIGASRGFAFVHFSTIADSSAFIETFGPSIRIGEARCRVAFTRERDDGDRRGRRRDDDGEEWRCRVVGPRVALCARTNGLTFDVSVSFGQLPSAPGVFPLFDPQIRFVVPSRSDFLRYPLTKKPQR
jgi:RNA recognition motif-containing protein